MKLDSEAPDADHAESEEGIVPNVPAASHGKMATPPDAPPGIGPS